MNNDTYNVKLIRKEKLDNEYYGFDFEKPEGYSFLEGQYAIFKLADKGIVGKDFRIFSIASTNEDDFIRIATRISNTPSDFKRTLLALEVGEEINVSSPKGKFVLDPEMESVFIAGGIGITPIRSMILYKATHQGCAHDELIYSELESCYPYKSELEHINGLHIDYAADIEPTQSAIRHSVELYHNDAVYYVSGSPGFVKGISGLLVEQGITEDHIRHDLFIGY
ncbi:MAG: FAD-dependent oxidoreductase [Bacilli bacterium]|nr:FAD-dependent oxidoreductase [Bacilli bacterium]MBN2876189.1 FAD-dependent oxidoreductase [Bacilli bacterium]